MKFPNRTLKSAIAAGLAVALCPVQPAVAQEPDFRFADVLAPHYDRAPTEDILGIKLGMNLDQVLVALVANGFKVQGDSLGRTARGRGAMRFLSADRPHENTRPSYDRIIVYFDFSEKPRAIAVYRNSDYRRGHYPAYSNVMGSLADKYGDAPVWDSRNNEVLISWHRDKLSRKCGPMQTNFRYFRAPQDIELYEGCFRGLAAQVGYLPGQSGRPVESTRFYLFDTRLLDANYKETFRLAREQQEQRERKAREKTFSNTTTDL